MANLTDAQKKAVHTTWINGVMARGESTRLGKSQSRKIVDCIDTVYNAPGVTTVVDIEGAAVRTELATQDAPLSAEVTDAMLQDFIEAYHPIWRTA